MLLRTLLLLLSAGAMIASANTFLFTVTPNTLVGDPLQFEIFQATLTTPTAGNSNYVLTVQTNYGVPIPGSSDTPPVSAVVPQVLYQGALYSISDFLISWDGMDYGVVLGAHDGYVAGNLYQAPGFQTSLQVTGTGFGTSRASIPVLLDAGGSFAGTGAESGSLTGNGVTTGLYTIVDTFAAPPGFLLDGNFNIIMSSFVCANDLITGSGNSGQVPEPSTIFQCIPALLLIGFGAARQALRTRKAARRSDL
jgi:hypothetical protein